MQYHIRMLEVPQFAQYLRKIGNLTVAFVSRFFVFTE
jgi:hypothetical protein